MDPEIHSLCSIWSLFSEESWCPGCRGKKRMQRWRSAQARMLGLSLHIYINLHIYIHTYTHMLENHCIMKVGNKILAFFSDESFFFNLTTYISIPTVPTSSQCYQQTYLDKYLPTQKPTHLPTYLILRLVLHLQYIISLPAVYLKIKICLPTYLHIPYLVYLPHLPIYHPT